MRSVQLKTVPEMGDLPAEYLINEILLEVQVQSPHGEKTAWTTQIVVRILRI